MMAAALLFMRLQPTGATFHHAKHDCKIAALHIHCTIQHSNESNVTAATASMFTLLRLHKMVPVEVETEDRACKGMQRHQPSHADSATATTKPTVRGAQRARAMATHTTKLQPKLLRGKTATKAKAKPSRRGYSREQPLRQGSLQRASLPKQICIHL